MRHEFLEWVGLRVKLYSIRYENENMIEKAKSTVQK